MITGTHLDIPGQCAYLDVSCPVPLITSTRFPSQQDPGLCLNNQENKNLIGTSLGFCLVDPMMSIKLVEMPLAASFEYPIH